VVLGHLPDGRYHGLVRLHRVDALGLLIQQLLHGKHGDLRVATLVDDEWAASLGDESASP
jgi:hypothetical protein